MDIKDTIRKLLALATSPNEHEARAALLKAKKLMMTHKISEEEFKEPDNQLIYLDVAEVKWTTDSGHIWMVELGSLIGENYLCSVVWATPAGTRTHTARVVGIGEDAQICKAALTYAIGFVMNQIKIQQRKSLKSPETVRDSYAAGFILGLRMAFEEQREQNSSEWGLVEVKPEKVKEYERCLKEKKVTTRRGGFDPLAYMRGQKDGIEFRNKKVIEGGVTA